MQVRYLVAAVLAATLCGAGDLVAHCQIPCGIFDDQARIAALREDVQTVAKAIGEIQKLSAQTPVNYNQIVRWVQAKDEHAHHIQEIAADYFLAQRVKPQDGDGRETYIKQLTLLHGIVVNAMKAKQNTDTLYTDALRQLVDEFASSYSPVPAAPAPAAVAPIAPVAPPVPPLPAQPPASGKADAPAR